MPNYSNELNYIFHALADATRRGVLEQLTKGPAPVSKLAKPFRMTLSSFLQHLEVLEQCGLVESKKSGRMRMYQLAPKSLKIAESWIAKQRKLSERRWDHSTAV